MEKFPYLHQFIVSLRNNLFKIKNQQQNETSNQTNIQHLINFNINYYVQSGKKLLQKKLETNRQP